MKKLTAFIFALFLMFCAFALADEVRTDGNFEYIVLEDGTAEIVGTTIYGGSKAVVTVPATLGGYPVSSIGNEGLFGIFSTPEIILPEGVTRLGTMRLAPVLILKR